MSLASLRPAARPSVARPACMTDHEFGLWSEANRTLTKGSASPCFDCPAAFAAEMRSAGCCDGEPQTTGRPAKRGPRVALIGRQGRGVKYATEELRLAARRQTYRESARRRRTGAAA